ncbi:hypothetical protein ABZ719_26645 [Streptomyces sp. NPDC006743]|uniref:hypothetical protein n=1 Tax=Streptomyces sp. NPDC006743 TaxID=3154480 RepID=UPI0034542F29
MLNRIRRAVSLTRERHFRKGRHRRPSTSSRPPTAFTLSMSTDGHVTDVTGQGEDTANRLGFLAGEDNALVRPYVTAWERRVRQRPVVVVRHPPAEAWSALAGASQ